MTGRITIFTTNTSFTLRKFWKITKRFLLALLLLVFVLYGALHLPPVQNWLVKRVAANLSEKLHATISIRHIDYSFFDKMDLNGLLVEDLNKDTLLFAGSAKVNITDWFFLKDKATLNYVALDDAIVNMHRSDSVWNYQFLIDYFSSPKKTTAKNGGIEFSLKELKLHNISFKQLDKWKGKDMQVSLKNLSLLTDDIDFYKKKISISKLDIEEPVFTKYDYTGVLDSLNRTLPPKPKDTTHKQNNNGWVIIAKNVHISNGIFGNETENRNRAMYTGRFDGSHIRFTNINADFRNTHFQNDSITTDLVLSTKERSGFEVKKLQASMLFTPEIMEFNNLDLVTNKSRLGNYYSMRYKDFNPDMGNFEHKINLEANFINSELNSDDLAFFAPDVKSWKRIFKLAGHARGTVDNFTVKKMLIKSGNSILDGDIALRGLPDIDNTFIDFKANELNTTYSDLLTVIPTLKEVDPPKLSRLGNIRYKGNYTGFIKDFVAFGTISTDLGTITGDLNLKLPEGKVPVYSGKISTQGFRLGQFIDDGNLGNITFNGTVNGSGFSTKNLDANFNGDISSVEYSGYNYQHIIIKGDFKKNFFRGLASINDPNLKVDNLVGTIDLNGKAPAFNFDAQIAKADFKKLNLTKDEFELMGHFNFNFTGNNIDNFLGTAKINEASLLHNGLPLSFDSLVLRSEILNGQKYLSLHSNEVDADITGNFKILELPDAFKIFLSRYYPSYIKKPGYKVSDQDFSFEIKTKNASDYIQVMDKKLKGFDNSTISGNLKLQSNELNINAAIPAFSFDGKTFNNIRLKSKGSLDSLATAVDVDDIAISDSFRLPSTNLVFTSFNDTSNISIKTSASKTISDAAINAQLVTMSDGVKIHFFPSSFIINDKKWQLEKDGEITFSKSQIGANDVKFVQGNQEINISTEPSETLTTHDIVVKLNKVNIDDITMLASLTKPKLQGLVTGIIRIEDPFKKPYIHYDTDIEAFKTDNDSIGHLNVTGTYNIAAGELAIKASAENKDNQLEIDGIIYLKDSTASQTRIALKSEKFDLSILNNYLGDIFSNIKGSANTTDLALSGNSKHFVLTGTANINEASLVVNFTQCKYKFKNESIIFNPDEIDFGKIALKDALGNDATLTGKMYHHFFKNIEFDDIRFETNRLLVLNTTKKDNSQFYGKVIGKADFLLTGNEDNITMTISGEPSRRDSSHIYILSGNSIENGMIDYIDFIQFGNKMEETYRSRSSSNIVVNMALTANPSCKIDVILDESTGDIIKGEGEGLLKIRVGNKENLSINGRYDITRGEYTFNFQTFLKKYFTVNSGTLVWDGDPFKAKIDILAEYLATGVDFSNLSAGTVSTGGSTFKQKSDLRVLAHLTETLLKPTIDFEFQLPPGSPITDFLILKRLEQFKEDKNDLNKQVTSLLLFNSFINTNQGFISANSGYNVLAGTIGGVVSNAISGFFNALLQKYVKNLTFSLDVNTSLESVTNADLQNNVAKLQAAAKSNFIYTLLKGRLIITAGVNLDYNNPYANVNKNTNVLITPDITAEFILTKDGRLRLVGFNRTNYDLVGQRNRTGVSLSYRKDVDKLTQIFQSRRSGRKQQEKETK